jgi:hypothetical protein
LYSTKRAAQQDCWQANREHADDAAVFVAPVKEDIQHLAIILETFGEVTGLRTNFQKSSVVPIMYGHMELGEIPEGIPMICDSFPMRYLGLPLSV